MGAGRGPLARATGLVGVLIVNLNPVLAGIEMAHSLADWDLKSRVRPPRTESILDDPTYSQNAGNR